MLVPIFLNGNFTKGYVLQMTVYQGKRFDPTLVGTLQGTNVVMNLMKDSRLPGKGFHVFADSFFSSLNLANKLLWERTYLTGTLKNVACDGLYQHPEFYFKS
jgi:hypothetical protein